MVSINIKNDKNEVQKQPLTLTRYRVKSDSKGTSGNNKGGGGGGGGRDGVVDVVAPAQEDGSLGQAQLEVCRCRHCFFFVCEAEGGWGVGDFVQLLLPLLLSLPVRFVG